MKRVALYLRVSSDTQTTDNQVPECEELAGRLGDVVQRYQEIGSAVKRRPALESLFVDAKRRRFDILVIWAIDRFGRSMVGNLNDLLELDRLGVQVVSVREPWLDTGGPVRGLLIAIFSWAAEQERSRLVERTKAGLERARRLGTRSGRKIGRPRVRVDLDEARRLIAGGASQREVAVALSCGLATLQRGLQKAKAA